MMFNERNFYKNTPDGDLTYSGSDTIVWDRVNAERLARGLPGLAAIGFPRPPEEPGASPEAASANGNGRSFTFTGNDNQVYEVNVPSGMSESEARSYFNKELNSGKLTNLNIGQSLEGLSEKAAGALAQIGKLTNLPVNLPINPAQILKQAPSTMSIGSLGPAQVTGLLSQAAASVSQTAGSLGIGKFGLTPQQLQEQGFLKPGTVEQFIGKGNTDFSAILKSSGCWTGKGGASGIDGFLKNSNLQDSTQQALMSKGFEQLKSLGTITGKESPQQLAAMVQGSAKFGAGEMAAWAKGAAPSDLVNSINGLAKDAQFASALTDNLPDVVPSIEGVVNTVDRGTLDKSIKGFLGNDKIPSSAYGPLARQTAKNVEVRLYANTSDEDLIYTGDDYIVWDRINDERLRRGLKSLTDIGIPRPPEDTPTINT